MTVPDPDPPLVEIDAVRAAEDATRIVSGSLREAIDRGRPFLALVRMPDAPPRGGRLGDVTERVRTLKLLRPGLRVWCRGLAFLVGEQTLARQAKAIRSGDKLWGCPTLTTADETTARAWLRARAEALDEGAEP